MNTLKNQPVSLKQLNKKLDVEAKRIVREREEGITTYVSKKAVLGGDSKMIFKDANGMKITLSYRLNENGNLRFSYEKRFV